MATGTAPVGTPHALASNGKYSSMASKPMSTATAIAAPRAGPDPTASATPDRRVARNPGSSSSSEDGARGASGSRVARAAADRQTATLANPSSG
jgi:hypothetical protein